MKPVVIFGLGSYARVAKVYLEADSDYRVVAFTANAQYIEEETLLDVPVVPFETLAQTHPPDNFTLLVAIGASGMNTRRAQIYQQCRQMGYDFVRYVNSTVRLWGEVEIGDNTFIFEDNVIQPFVKIGSNTVLWSGNHIGHDSTIGDHVFIASHAVVSGHCTVSDYCFLGVNATLIDHISLAPYTLVGAGAMITRDTDEKSAHIGTRATLAKRSSLDFNL
jgi:sugar O-acyltransferase (sialic acid O-acetyltransferase NeuD family)